MFFINRQEDGISGFMVYLCWRTIDVSWVVPETGEHEGKLRITLRKPSRRKS